MTSVEKSIMRRTFSAARIVEYLATQVRFAWRSRWALLFASPFFILFAIFFAYPLGFAVWLSFTNWLGPEHVTMVGLDNYAKLLHDQRFWSSFGNIVIIFLMYVPPMTALATVFAVILNAGFVRLQGFWRALIFLPNITSMVAAGYVFKVLLETNSGFVNGALGLVGASPIPWLDDPTWARISISLLVTWVSLGFNSLIILSGLQAIPRELEEAARVDGATRRQAFWHITVPLLRPQIIFSFTMSVLGSFQLYTEPYILTKGGPIGATDTPAMEIYNQMFVFVKYGYAAALSIVFMLIVVVVTLLQYRFTSRWEQVW